MCTFLDWETEVFYTQHTTVQEAIQLVRVDQWFFQSFWVSFTTGTLLQSHHVRGQGWHQWT